MSSFRDKINSKINSSIKNREQNLQNITTFDETFIKITVVGGQTQLCPIKLNCIWLNSSSNQRPPQLECKWFNKTDNSMSLIEGVNGSYYQPCLEDVGTIVHVQCVPVLEGGEYEGMPIIKEIGPIKIDNQTEQESNDLLDAKKGTFSLKIKSIGEEFVYHEGLIKIVRNNLRIVTKLNQKEEELCNITINENQVKTKCVRTKPKEIQFEIVQQNGNQINMLVELTSNKIRDLFILLIKLISAKTLTETEEGHKYNQQQSKQKMLDVNEKKEKEEKLSETGSQKQRVKVHQPGQQFTGGDKNEKQGNLQQKCQQTTLQKNQQIPKELQTGETQNNNRSISKKSQTSEEQIQEPSKTSEKKVNEVKSSQDLSISSPAIKKVTSSAFTPSSTKQNALQILQLSQLKKDMRNQESEILLLKKSLKQKNQEIENLKEEVSRMKEREANLNCNYFQLEDQMKKTKVDSQKHSQEISYYSNQNRILKSENEGLMKSKKDYKQRIEMLQKKLQPFLHENDKQKQQVESYAQLKQKYDSQMKLRMEIQIKYDFIQKESVKIEERFIQANALAEEANNLSNYYKKKYQNISQELQLSQNDIASPIRQSILSSPVKLLKEQSVYSKSSIDDNDDDQQKYNTMQNFNRIQGEVLILKKQLKQAIEENNFLRSLNVIGAKDKKSSSKQHLKLEVLEMKKIVNRLTETVTQKDLALQHMKIVNKEISQKLLRSSFLVDGENK